MDFTGSWILLLVLIPLLVILALIVKLDSHGPILHRRRVLGRNGTEFDAFKFRTMQLNGHELLAAQPELKAALAAEHKIKNDPRLTRSGRWLRKLSLDELPQLLNVLRGQMSLVGPRMIAPIELSNYGSFAAELLTVKPGLTGVWQLSGRSDLSYADRVQLDIRYIRTRSIWIDLRLLLKTPWVVITGRGAY
ncbi:MAG TPA: sugar transferase [Anaerolineae bacterium]|nr:sugar transferase [Anaerolineae bacterium]